jgi:hypothetical protein
MRAIGSAAESEENEETGNMSYRIKSLAELKRQTYYMGL